MFYIPIDEGLFVHTDGHMYDSCIIVIGLAEI